MMEKHPTPPPLRDRGGHPVSSQQQGLTRARARWSPRTHLGGGWPEPEGRAASCLTALGPRVGGCIHKVSGLSPCPQA